METGSGALEPLGDGIWIADGPVVVAAMGFHYPTRMAVIRLDNGDLFIWSPVGLTDPLRREMEALGRVRFLIAPNDLHHLSLGDWARAYPEAAIRAAPGLSGKRPDLTLDGELGDAPDPEWAGEVDQVTMRGNRITTEVVFFHRRSGTVLFCDLLQRLPRGWYSGWRAVVARLDLMTAPSPAVPRKFRLAFSDRRAARRAVDRVLAWPVEAVVIAHGEPIRKDGGAALREAFRWLKA